MLYRVIPFKQAQTVYINPIKYIFDIFLPHSINCFYKFYFFSFNVQNLFLIGLVRAAQALCPGGIGGTKEEQHKWVLPILNRCGEIVQEYVRVGMKKSKASSIRDNARVVVGK